MATTTPVTQKSSQPVKEATIKPVEVRELTKEFDKQAVVDRVSFDIAPGTIFGFIGPSGSGKTTTVRMLTGIYLPTSGEVRVLGHKPTLFTRHDRERIGYMPQHFVLYPDLSVWENLSFAASIYGIGFGRAKYMKELLDFVELTPMKNKRVKQISGGEQRRLSLASTLAHDPDLIFLDEPTTGLDPILRKKFWDYFTDLKKSGITLFVTTQYVSDAAYCDVVGIMAEGKLVAMDTPVGLRRQALGGEVVILRALDRVDQRQILSLSRLSFVKRAERYGENEVRIIVKSAPEAIPALVEWSREKGIRVESIQEYTPPYDDVFVSLIRKENHNGA
jgi:ABC-2 type transport system ATP-binding protein